MKQSTKSFRLWIGFVTAAGVVTLVVTLLSNKEGTAGLPNSFVAENVFPRQDEPAPRLLVSDDEVGLPHRSARPLTSAEVRISETYAKLPLTFEVNRGQTNSHVKFLSRGHGYTLFLTSTEAVMSLRRRSSTSKAANGVSNLDGAADEIAIVRMKILDGNENPVITGVDKLRRESNYFTGNDPAAW